jgi:hypothetical protein
MNVREYVLSLLVAAILLAGAGAWTQAAQADGHTVASCQAGQALAPVFLKGFSVYPRCPGGRRG